MNLDAISSLSQSPPAKATLFGGAKNMTPEKAETASKDFESMFISQMVEQMFGETEGSEAFGSDESDQVYKSLMVQEYGKMITQSGGIGIAAQINSDVKRELLKQQEVKG
jgi:Rod binding domain-containing protein